MTWDSVHRKWKIVIRNHNKAQSLGLLADLDQAIAMRQEAEGLTLPELQALKAKYGIGGKRGRRGSHPWGFPAPNAPAAIAEADVEPVMAVADGDLAALLRMAEAADADALIAQQAAERANETAFEALDRAATSWRRFIEAARAHSQSGAFVVASGPNANGHEPKE